MNYYKSTEEKNRQEERAVVEKERQKQNWRETNLHGGSFSLLVDTFLKNGPNGHFAILEAKQLFSSFHSPPFLAAV